MDRRRLDVKQAAQVLGISTDAVHKRVKRGSLESEKDEAGHVFVWLDSPDNGYTQDSQDVQPLLIARLENENEFLRQELEQRAEELSEMRRIVAALVQRVPELEPARPDAPPEPREGDPETVASANTEEGEGIETPLREEYRPWWRRIFGP
jgi:hypothetical protein